MFFVSVLLHRSGSWSDIPTYAGAAASRDALARARLGWEREPAVTVIPA
jgi:hypothetical protein